MRKLINRIAFFVAAIIILTFWFVWNQPVEENEESNQLLKKFSEAAVNENIISRTDIKPTYTVNRLCTLFYWRTLIQITGNVTEKQKTDLRKLADSIEEDSRREDKEVQHIQLIFSSLN